MDLKKDFKKYLVLFAFISLITLSVTLWVLYIPIFRREPIPGERKAIILCSANDFYRKDGFPDFDEGDFNNETTNWEGEFNPNGYGIVGSSIPGHNTPGVIQLIAKANFSNAYVEMEFVYNWTKYFELFKYAAYNLSAWVNITTNTWTPASIVPATGDGAKVGLRWLNASNEEVRTDWSNGLLDTPTGWTMLNSTGIADNSTMSEITQLHLVLSVEGNMTGTDMVLFDDVKVEYWFPPPIPTPPPSNIDTDGFPAQALQVYWVLRDHEYKDNNIFLMLYHTGDAIIDINAGDGIANDLTGAIVDVENDDVTSSRFTEELNVTHPGSFASNITGRDQLIIYMVDHGSNTILGDGNATFHFEADDSYISEQEFFNLVKEINCRRMMINIDICFSGNFLFQDSINWYNLPKSILITSTTDILSWYWRNNNNPDGFAGSWFFHQFWDRLNQNYTVEAAYNSSIAWIPSGQVSTISDIQTPLLEDYLGIKDIWSFNSTLQL